MSNSSEMREQEAAEWACALGLNRPRFQLGPELQLAGVNQRYTKATRGGIPRQWEQFVPVAHSFVGRVGDLFYGVCWNATPTGDFDYLTCVEIGEANPPPDEWKRLMLAARRYAVFAHSEHVATIAKTIDRIWSQWAPQCGLAIAHEAPCFERYTAEFDPQTGLGGMEVWIPLRS